MMMIRMKSNYILIIQFHILMVLIRVAYVHCKNSTLNDDLSCNVRGLCQVCKITNQILINISIFILKKFMKNRGKFCMQWCTILKIQYLPIRENILNKECLFKSEAVGWIVSIMKSVLGSPTILYLQIVYYLNLVQKLKKMIYFSLGKRNVNILLSKVSILVIIQNSINYSPVIPIYFTIR